MAAPPLIQHEMCCSGYVFATTGLVGRNFLSMYCAGYERFERCLLGAHDGVPNDADNSAFAHGHTGAGTRTAGDGAEMSDILDVRERGRTLTFTFEDMNRYHGGHYPAGVALAFKAMQRGFSVISPGGPPERRACICKVP